VITGGDTAQATLARLGVRSVDVRTSLFPGVVHGTAPFAGQELGIVTKAGGFGDPDLFVRLASRLVGAVAG
jgi:4-hydroxythreonine-4-phosphate dehydrogenase